MRNGATTHAFDMDQRYVGLSFTAGSGVLTVTGPPNGNIAPPGYYMLFLVNSVGVPSVASMVQVSTAPGRYATDRDDYQSGGQRDHKRRTVGFLCWHRHIAGRNDYRVFLDFEGGTQHQQCRESRQCDLPNSGTFVTPLTVTDNHGQSLIHIPHAHHHRPGPPDFTLSASPNSQSIAQGAGTPYTATITPDKQLCRHRDLQRQRIAHRRDRFLQSHFDHSLRVLHDDGFDRQLARQRVSTR